ncbi:MAG: hypothetical protein ACK4TF_08025 [Thermodesulfovibrionales bacterium]
MDVLINDQIGYFYEVEGLSIRQIAKRPGISRKKESRIIKGERLVKPPRDTIMKDYKRLIDEWYGVCPLALFMALSLFLHIQGIYL